MTVHLVGADLRSRRVTRGFLKVEDRGLSARRDHALRHRSSKSGCAAGDDRR